MPSESHRMRQIVAMLLRGVSVRKTPFMDVLFAAASKAGSSYTPCL